MRCAKCLKGAGIEGQPAIYSVILKDEEVSVCEPCLHDDTYAIKLRMQLTVLKKGARQSMFDQEVPILLRPYLETLDYKDGRSTPSPGKSQGRVQKK